MERKKLKRRTIVGTARRLLTGSFQEDVALELTDNAPEQLDR
jgi:hypothetical protein